LHSARLCNLWIDCAKHYSLFFIPERLYIPVKGLSRLYFSARALKHATAKDFKAIQLRRWIYAINRKSCKSLSHVGSVKFYVQKKE